MVSVAPPFGKNCSHNWSGSLCAVCLAFPMWSCRNEKPEGWSRLHFRIKLIISLIQIYQSEGRDKDWGTNAGCQDQSHQACAVLWYDRFSVRITRSHSFTWNGSGLSLVDIFMVCSSWSDSPCSPAQALPQIQPGTSCHRPNNLTII